ncbi:response regulator [Nonlabens xiamenensis]|uniref:response regulator n=1 Tax=Nonlabens xiamenensis TaxID=2341043 RepID=UPI000F60EA22|nr:transporter substrate-binding domain-containing protein [Nonlabens xiamenensis]
MIQRLPRFILFISVLTGIAFACSSGDVLTKEERDWLKNNDPVKVAVYPYYPPYIFKNEEGNPEGILYDYLKLLEKKLDTKFEVVEYSDFSVVIEDAQNGKIDWILEVQETESRKEYLKFYTKLFETPFVIVGHKDQQKSYDRDSLSTADFYLPKDFAISESILRDFPEANVISNCATDEECLRKLLQNKQAYFIGPQTVVTYFTESKGLEDLIVLGNLGRDYDPSMAAVKDNEMLNSLLYKGLNEITYEEKKEVINRWLVMFNKPIYKTERFWITATILILSFLLALLVINRYLKYTIKRRTKQLEQAKEKAEESSILKTSFINNITHEMRTPMNAVMGFSGLLKNNHVDRETRLEYINIINQGCLRLMDMMDNVLEVSLLQSNQIKTLNTSTDVKLLIQQCYDKFKDQAIQKKIKYDLNVPIDESQNCVLVDQAKLRKIILHTLNNAIKFTASGSISLSGKIIDDQLYVSISDTGIGISEKRLESIFDSYSKSNQDTTELYEGLGLGLTISKAYADLMNGRLEIHSKLGKGTEVEIWVPVHDIGPSEECQPQQRKLRSESPLFKVLIAEDVQLNFMFLKALLDRNSEFDIQVLRAENGQEAVDHVRSGEHVDLVFMDIQMPIMNGYRATELIKTYNAQIPVVMQTAYTTISDKQKAMEAGCDDFISKPVKPEIVSKMLFKFLKVTSSDAV